MAASERWIELEGVVNARVVVPGVLIRAANLQALTDRDISVLVADQRVEVVVDLRSDVEVSSEGPGPLAAHETVRIEHRSLYPDSGGAELATVAVRPWDAALSDELPEETRVVRAYLGYMERRPDSIVGAIRTIALASGAILVHCAAGKDRTGLVVAVALDAAGVARAAIVRDYVATAERIDAIIAQLLGSRTYNAQLLAADREQLVPRAATLERVLEIVDARFGGSARWLAEHGLTDSELDALRRRIGSAGPS